MKSSMQGRVLEMSPGNSSVPNCDSSVVCLADIIMPNQSHRKLDSGATWKTLCSPSLNKATIFMAENTDSTQRARHIDIKCRWVSQLIQEGFLKILFVQSADNLSDECTENVSPEVCNAHTPHSPPCTQGKSWMQPGW